MRATNQLSAVKIARLTKPGRYCDGQGLYLQVSPGGSKAWLFRYMRDGVARQMGLTVRTLERQKLRYEADAPVPGIFVVLERA